MDRKLIDKRIELSSLFDVYCGMLTKKQRQSIEMHFDDDLSYSEIAELLSISKQAVHDNLNKAIKNLYNLEEKIGFVGFIDELENRIENIIKAIPDISEKEIKDKLLELKNLPYSLRFK